MIENLQGLPVQFEHTPFRLTDDEISPAFVCQLLNSGDEDVYKFARKDFVCPDTQQEYQIVNPYSQKDSNSCGDT